MKENKDQKILFIIGLIPVIWIALLIAPSISGGLPTIIKDFPKTMENPFSIVLCSNSIKTILIFIVAYILGIGIYLSTKRNYRKREEHGSAKWGEAKDINKKYEQVPYSTNKILTQNVCIGYDGRGFKYYYFPWVMNKFFIRINIKDNKENNINGKYE